MVPWRPQERVKGRAPAVRSDVEFDDEAPWVASHLPLFPVVEHGERLTATDLLGWWFRPPRRHEQAWESFFEAAERPAQGHASRTSEPLERSEAPSADSLRQLPRSWTMLRSFMQDAESQIIDEQAEGALECLYEFLHAIERRDTDGALERVTPDFHTVEDDREVTKADLRIRIESLLDWMGDAEAEVSLTTVPEPMFHPLGVIIGADIQIHVNEAGKEPRIHVDERVALCQQQADGSWGICALSPMRK